MSYSILIAEDDLSIAELIRLSLQSSGYTCHKALTGTGALEAVKQKDFHLALLDVMLPDIDGYAILAALSQKNIPAIFVTAKTGVLDKVHGLRLGAEDYIAKPFDLLELLARVEVVLRRYHQRQSEAFEIEDIRVELGGRKVFKQGKPVALTPKEYELLEFLLKNPNIAFSRESLLNQVWGYDYFGGTRTVDTHILNLRNKLGLSRCIRTVHKIGYRLEL